jgi:hypothetical protein
MSWPRIWSAPDMWDSSAKPEATLNMPDSSPDPVVTLSPGCTPARRSGCQLMTVKSRTAHASDSEWSELFWASSGRTVSSPRCGQREYGSTE